MSDVAAPAGRTGIQVQRRALVAVEFARRHSAVLQLAAATLVYLAFACYLTWPLVTHLNTVVYGPPGDPFGSMAGYRELADHHHNPFLPGTISQFAAPEGQPIAWARNLAALGSILTQYLFTAAFGQVASLGLYTLLGYTLSGVLMFLFVRRLTAIFWVALLCGWAFAFYPFAVLNGLGHEDFIHGWVLVLAVWRLVELYWAPSRRNAILAALAVMLSMWWTPYFILIGGVAYLVAVLASLMMAWRARRLRAVLAPYALTVVIVVVFLALLASLSAAQSGPGLGLLTQPLAAFNTYSARPLEYVLPDKGSPLFGSLTRGYLTSHLHGSNDVESTLYVGVTTILLAAVAGIALLRGRLEPRVWSAAFILSLVTLAALLSSAPPEATVFGLTIPFPSHFIMKVTTTWRAYSRFVVLVMLGLVALAGIGLKTMLAVPSRHWRLAVMLAGSVLVPLDLWSRVDEATTVTVPTVYRVLAREPRGLVAEYPLVPAGSNLYLDLFYQNIYGMPMINGYEQGSVAETRALSLANLSNPTTGPRLAALGVRYVIREAARNPFGQPSPGTPGRGFRLVYSDAYGSLYIVTARPAGPALPTLDGFGATEPRPHGESANWLENPSGSIELAGPCLRCKGVLRFTLASFGRPRVVTVRIGQRVLATQRVAGATRFAVPFDYSGPTRAITMTTAPGPQSIEKTLGIPDPRSVSVQISDLSLSWPAGHEHR